ncbi:MAG: PAS domain S-box protein, partial [Euryarchaeota archaeon]|nr:PAS domain S-box protein [Euryarchaeota archaeon]
FTGKGREDVVIEAINEGANFYLQKGGQPKAQFAELSHKIRQAISHKQAQEALSASEQFQRAVLSSSPIGISLVRNRILDWTNDTMCSMTGYSQEEFLGQSARMLYPDDGEFRRAGQLLYETGEVETEWVRKDGTLFPCILRMSPLNPASVEDGVIAAVVDITELKEAKELYQTIFENTGTAMMILEDDTIISHVNAEMESLWGYSKEKLEGRLKWPELVSEDDVGRMMEYHRLRRIDPDTAPNSYEFRFIKKHGEIRDASLVAGMIPGTKKSIISLIDITEQKDTEMQMAAQHDLGIKLTALSSLEEMFPLCVETAMRISGMDSGALYLVEQGTGDLILHYGVGVSDSFRHAASRYSSDLEITRRIMSGEQIYTTKDEFRHGFYDKAQNEGLTCICTLPVFFRGKVIGCMYLASHTSDEISPSHISTLETITAQIGNGIGRVLAEEEIRKLNQKQADIIEFLPDATFVIDRNARVIAWNRAIAEMTGVLKEDIVGKGDYAYAEAFYGERRPVLIDIIPGQDEVTEARYDLVKRNGENIYSEVYLPLIYGGRGGHVWAKASLLYDAEGNVTGAIESVRDISERKQAETALYEEREQLAVTLRSIGDGVIVTNTDDNVTMLNKVAEDLTGWSEQEAFGRPLSEVFHIINEKTREVCDNPVEKVLETGLVIGLANHTALIARDGTERSIADSGAPVRDKENRTIGVVLVFRDVTGEKRAEEALQQSEEHYRTLAESATDTIIRFDPRGLVTYINPVGANTMKMKQEEMIGKSPADLFPPDFPPEAAKNLTDNLMGVVRSKKSSHHEDKLPFAGQEMWYDSRVIPVMSGSGEVESVIVISRDVTDRKKAERRLKFAQFTIDNAADAIYWADDNGRFILVNDIACSLYGYSREELLKMSLTDLSPDFPPERYKKFWDKIKEEGAMVFEAEVTQKDGAVISVEVSVVHLSFKGHEYGCGFVRDITDRKAAERALDVTNKKLQLLSSITRHDILNQVAALAGYTDLLNGVLPDEPEIRKYIDRITKATSAIERQITFTRDYEHLGVDPSRWQRVADTAERAASGCADRSVNVSIGTGTLEVFADPMLEKVFFNLFDNTIRHGEHMTEISVTCRKGDGDGSVVIAVEDDGVGIPAKMKERIFGDGFGRHTGYGLFLVQEILAITGISIQETSEEGKGACFEIIVPNDVWRGD